MNTIKLDRKEIEEKIEAGNTYNGCYILAVAPDGSDHGIYWMEQNRQWDPWPDSWHIIGIPVLYPYGEGGEYEVACDCLEANGLDPDTIVEEIDESREYAGLVEYAEAKFPEWMEAAAVNELVFITDAFLDACNGTGCDLNTPEPWGYTSEQDGYEAIDPPAEFEWA